jgi:hypothetical protein
VPELGHWPRPGLLCGSLVFVDEATENRAALDLLLGDVGDGFGGPVRAELAAALESSSVVVAGILVGCQNSATGVDLGF